jgi:2-isopropylmalate synthase
MRGQRDRRARRQRLARGNRHGAARPPGRAALRHGIRSEGLFSASQLLSQITSEPVQSNKAIVGRNAFAHEAGIHQDGVLKDVKTYEIMRPEDVGQSVASRLVLGRHSGRHAVQCRCEALGFSLTTPEIDQVYHAVISLGEHRKAIADGDLRRIIDRVRTPASAAAVQPPASLEAVGYGHGV